MNKEQNINNPQSQQLNIADVISWRNIFRLFTFTYKHPKYDKGTRIALSILCWLNVVGLIILIWAMKLVYACL